MKVDPWVMPGSLQNLPPKAGSVPGFRFVFRTPTGVTHFYVAHRIGLTVDGKDASRNLKLRWKGETVAASQLPETTWVCVTGERIEAIAEWPNGLTPGSHRIVLTMVSGGGYGGGEDPGKPHVLCDFESEAA